MKWYQLLWSGIKATVSLTVGLSTIVLAVATILLWSSTNALVSEAESSSMREQRAYVTINVVKSVQLTAGERIPTAFHIKNHGRTPAVDVVVDAEAVLTDDIQNAEWPVGLRDASGAMVLGPGQQKFNDNRTALPSFIR